MEPAYVNKFKCRSGCSECCGPIPFEDTFIEKFQDYIQVEPLQSECLSNTMVLPLCPDGSCLFLVREDHRCAIYEVRPLVCRVYGTALNLPCVWVKPNGNPRSPGQSRRIRRQIRGKLVEGCIFVDRHREGQ